MSDQESVATAARLLRELSESDEVAVAVFFNALGLGMFDEWDCELSQAFEIFGEAEFLIGTRTAVLYAEAWAVKEAAVEGSVVNDGES